MLRNVYAAPVHIHYILCNVLHHRYSPCAYTNMYFPEDIRYTQSCKKTVITTVWGNTSYLCVLNTMLQCEIRHHSGWEAPIQGWLRPLSTPTGLDLKVTLVRDATGWIYGDTSELSCNAKKYLVRGVEARPQPITWIPDQSPSLPEMSTKAPYKDLEGLINPPYATTRYTLTITQSSLLPYHLDPTSGKLRDTLHLRDVLQPQWLYLAT